MFLKNTIAYLMMSFKMSFISNKKMLLRLKKTLPSSRSFTIEFKYTLISSPFEPLKRKIFWTNNFQWDKKMCYGMLSFFVNCDDASFTFSFGNGTIFCFHLNESTGSIKCFPLKMLYCLHLRHPFCLPFRPLFPFYSLIFFLDTM